MSSSKYSIPSGTFVTRFKILALRMALFILVAVLGTFSVVTVVGAARLYSPSISATKTDTLNDLDADNRADPGESIDYTTVISNAGTVPVTDDALATTFSDTIDPNTTLVTGSFNVSPLAGDDSYATIGNTLLEVGVAASGNPAVRVTTPAIDSLFDNDTEFQNDLLVPDTFSLKSVEAVSGAAPITAATESGGSVTVQANGTFSYTPAAGFTGADHFDYVISDDGTDSTPGNADDLTGAGRVTINVNAERVWYVKNNATAGGLGRSTDPFDTLAEAETASAANDTIYVFAGNGTTSGQNAGITLKDAQRLLGEAVDLTVPVGLTQQGVTGPNPTTLRLAGTRPMIGNSAGTGVTVSTATIGASFSGVEIRGLDIAGAGASSNAVDITTTSTFGGGFELADNVISASVAEGIDVNGGGSGTLTVSMHDNTVTAGGNGIDILRAAGGGSLNITTFDDNIVLGATGGTGINIVGTGGTVLFDTDPSTATYSGNAVLGGTTSIGALGNSVGTAGLVLNNVLGDLSFSDLNIYADNGAALSITGTTPNFLVSGTGTRVTATAGTPVMVAIGGAALNVTDANINIAPVTFTSSITTATSGVSLTRVSGTLTAPAGSVITSTNAGGTGFFVDGGSNANANVNVTYPGSITADIGWLVQIQDVTPTVAASYSFSGVITDNNDGDGSEQGVLLDNNDNATITFSGGLAVRTTGNAAFTATNGGTVNVCDENPCNPGATGALVNTLTTTTGTALNVANTNIGANNLEFRSINSPTASGNSGIVLNTTGSSGGLTVNGTGSAGSGGTISNKTVSGVSLTSTANLDLNSMNITGNGDAINENGIRAINVSGTSTLTGLSVTGSYHANVYLENNTTNTLDMTVSAGTFNSSTTHDGFHQVADGGASVTLTISNSIFSNNFSDGLDGGIANNAAPSTTDSFVSVTTSTLNNNGANGILIYTAGSGDSRFNIFSNTSISGNPSLGVNIFMNNGTLAAGKIRGRINNNTITYNTANGGGACALVNTQGDGSAAIEVTNNTCNYNDGSNVGMNIQSGDGGPGLTAVKFTNNTIHMIDTSTNNFALGAIEIFAGTLAADSRTLCLNLGTASPTDDSSVTFDAQSTSNGEFPLRIGKKIASFANIQGISPDPSTTVGQVQSFISTVTGLTPSSSILVRSTGTFNVNYTNATCDTSSAMAPSSSQVLAQAQPETDAGVTSAQAFTTASATVKLFSKQAAWAKPAPALLAGNQDSAKLQTISAVRPAPLQSNETVSIAAFTLPATKSITIKFRVTVDALDVGEIRTRILNQGTVSGSNFSTLSTTDPSASSDPFCLAAPSIGTKTCTPVDRPNTTVTSINRHTPSGADTNAASVTWRVTFGTAIAGLGSSNFSLDDPGGNPPTGESITSVTAVGGSPATQWDVLVDTGLGDGILGLDFANDTGLSHDVPAFTGGQDYIIDKTDPTTVSFTRFNPSSSPTNADTLVFRATFSEDVTNVDETDFVKNGTTTATVTNVSGSGDTYDVTISGGNLAVFEGTVGLDFSGAVDIIDLAGNSLAGTEPSPDETYLVDNTDPTVTINQKTSAPAQADPTNGSTINFTVVFDQSVGTSFVTGDVTLTGGAGATTGTVTEIAPNDGTTYNVAVTGMTSDGTVIASILAGKAQDLAGNDNEASTSGDNTVTYDTTAPTVTDVSSTQTDGTYGVGTLIPVTVQFSEAVTVTGTPQLTLETGATDRIVNYTSGSGTTTLTFNYTVQAGDTSPDLDYVGISSLALNSGTIKDAATNNATLTLATPGNAGSLGANKALVIDGVGPTVTNVTSSTLDGSYGTGAPISIQVTFSEAVNVTGTPQLTLETGPVDHTANYSSGTGTDTLTFDYTTQAGDSTLDLDYVGTGSLALNGGTIKDGALNNATLTLPTPGNTGSLGFNKAIVIDASEPTVINVTSPDLDGAYDAGSTIDVTVQFSESVMVTGTPQLTLETGSTDAVVNYSSGSGSDTLTFTYTVASGHNSLDLDYVNSTSLALNGGTIQDISTNDAILTLPNPGASGSLGANKAIVIDTITPVVTNVTSSTLNGAYNASDVISIQVVFSEAVIVTGTPQLTLETGTTDQIVDYTSGSGSNTLTFDYTVQAGDTSADLDYKNASALALNGGTIQDAATNNAILSPLAAPGAAGSLGANKDIVIDTTAPAVTSVTSSTTNGAYNVPDVISIQVVFTEAVVVTGTPQLTLETGATDAVVNYSSGSGSTTLTFAYTVASGDTSSDLDYTGTTALALNGGTITDAATNAADLTLATPGAAGSLGANKNIVIDTTEPTTSIGSTPANPTTSTSAAFTFSGADTGGSGVASFECQLDSGGFSACTTPKSYTSLADGSHTFDVRAIDNAGNADSTSASFTWVVDASAPDTIIDAPTPSDPTNNTTANFTFHGNDGTGVGGLTFECKLDAGSFGSCTSPKSYPGPLSDGSHTFQVRATDSLGNVDSSPASHTWVIDATDPTVTINQAVGQADPTNLNPIEFTVVFSEAVTGFNVAADVTLSGTASATVTGISGSGATYTVQVTATTDGTVIADVPAGSAQDPAANTNEASTSTDKTVTYDTVAPTVSIDRAAGQADTSGTSPVNFKFTFSEAMNVSSFTGADVDLSGTANPTTAVVSGGPTVFNVAVSGMNASGTVVVNLQASKATDAAGNANAAASIVDNSVNYIYAAPPVITEGASVGVTMSEDGSPTAFSLTLNATDANADPLTWSIVSPANFGTASAAAGPSNSSVISYTPLANYNGTDAFDVQVSDGALTDVITVNVTITPVADGPMTEMFSYNIQYDTWFGVSNPSAYGQGYRRATSGDFTFKPTQSFNQFKLVTYRGPDQGKAKILVDGVTKATIDLYNPTPQWQYVINISGLSNTHHTVIIRALNTKRPASTGKWVVVDGFRLGPKKYDDNAIIKNGMFAYGSWVGMINPHAFLGGYRISSKKDATIKFSFDGVELAWTTARGPAYGKAAIYVDGVLKQTVDLYKSSQQWQYKVTIAGLAYGHHNVVIKVLGIKNSHSSGTGILSDVFEID